MSNIIITAGSVTRAISISKKINSYSQNSATVIHTPSEINTGGCSYSVKTSSKNINLVKKLSSDNLIKYKKIYIESIIDGESVLREIS